MKLVQELPLLLQKGGFELTKWKSNKQMVLSGVSDDHRGKSIEVFGEKVDHTLGVAWEPEKDVFKFVAQLSAHDATRRGMLSAASSVFDPLGLIAPLTFISKMIMQTLSRQRFGWDDPVPASIWKKWEEWCSHLPLLRQVEFPRLCVLPGATIELHVFADASELGYGSCAYLRSVADGVIHCTLVMGKSRLAPIKPVSMPRLELTAAMVASKVKALVVHELSLPVERVVMWTDSMITLGYIRNKTTRY